MKLTRMLDDHLIVEAIHPDLYASAVTINKKVAEQLKNISAFSPEENPDVYKNGWVIGHLTIGSESRPVAMLMDGSIIMQTQLWKDTHTTWANVEKFILYAQKQLKKAETPLVSRFIKALEEKADWSANYYSADGKMYSWNSIPAEEPLDPSRFSFSIHEYSWDKIAKYVGMDVSLDAPIKRSEVPATPGLDDKDEFQSYGGRKQILIDTDGIKIFEHQKPPVEPTWWPPELIAALNKLYVKKQEETIPTVTKHRVDMKDYEARNAEYKRTHEAAKEAEIQKAVDARLAAQNKPDTLR